MMQKLTISNLVRPYFVYGTLRPNYWNSHIWVAHGATASHDGRVIVRGFRMHCAGAIPFAIASGEATDVIVGSLIVPNQDDLDSCWQLRRALDQLEGYPHGYDRLVVDAVSTDDLEAIEAWIYSPTGWPAISTQAVPSPADYAQLVPKGVSVRA
jgi:gamma-glutamylcyclotransferase (GGCT)/AIG2-like uncharacterized protein YtfP